MPITMLVVLLTIITFARAEETQEPMVFSNPVRLRELYEFDKELCTAVKPLLEKFASFDLFEAEILDRITGYY